MSLSKGIKTLNSEQAVTHKIFPRNVGLKGKNILIRKIWKV